MKRPIVAILGRPNVGKSTLFNRILRRREAIVDDQPGVTRDRKYAPAEWAGREFDLLDTGGYVPTTEDVFEQAIREQVQLAISEADLIVFVVDITTGITAIDDEIAQILLKSKAPVLLCVNKVDNEQREADIYEFYNLGLGDPYAISALNGRTIGDFLDAVMEKLPYTAPVPDEQNDDRLKLAVIGRPNVGKSSYVNALLGQSKMIVTEIAGTTRDAIDTELRYKNQAVVLIDTAGLRRRAKVKENVEFFSSVRTSNALRRCDIAIVLIDATEGLTDQDKTVIMNAVRDGKGVVLGVNKWDLVEKETNTARQFELDMQEELRDLAYVPIMFISAFNKQRVFKLLDVAIAVQAERQKRIPTPELNRFLRDAVEEHHPPAYGTKWVKLNYVTQIRTEPPLFAFYTNEPKGIKNNYRNYLENRLRQTFGFMGVPVRLSFRQKN